MKAGRWGKTCMTVPIRRLLSGGEPVDLAAKHMSFRPILTGLLVLLLFPPSVLAKAFEDSDCLLCHGEQSGWDMSKPEEAARFIVPASWEGSVHIDLSCTDCHEGIEDLPHEEQL